MGIQYLQCLPGGCLNADAVLVGANHASYNKMRKHLSIFNLNFIMIMKMMTMMMMMTMTMMMMM